MAYLLLFVEHGIEPAYGIGFQTGHGTAAIQDKNEFGKSLFHKKSSMKAPYLMQSLWRT